MNNHKLDKLIDIEELEYIINAYFDKQDKYNKPYTISGLGLVLGVSRQALLNWSNKDYIVKSLSVEDNHRLVDIIKTAKQRIESYAEEQLYRPQQVAGVIFNLKNNYGWKDAQSVEVIDNKKPDLSNLSTEDIRALIDQSK